ncbi:MAG: Calx-beta domain-containing protein, partial [Planctomycetota bacterium]
MSNKLTFPVLVIVLLGVPCGAGAFPLRVDVGNIGQVVKPGWAEFSGNGNEEPDPKTEVFQVGELSITVVLRTGVINDSGYRSYGGGELGGDMLYPDDYYGSVNGRVILTLCNLPAGDYILTSYHNDTKGTHAQQDPIDVTVSGAILDSTNAIGVVQTKSPDDNNLGHSVVAFAADGGGDVVVTYTPTTDVVDVSKAVLNGFELDTTDATVQFDSSGSAGPESKSPAVIPVNLYNPPQGQTATVQYAVTGGSADGNGVDYVLDGGTLVFEPGEASEDISIVIVEDDFDEDPDETIEITLFNPTNAKLGVHAKHTFIILPPAVRVCPRGDLDGDCDLDLNDVGFFAGQWLDPPNSCSGFDCADL